MKFTYLYVIQCFQLSTVAHTLVHSQWLTSDTCTGPPSSVLSFSISDLEASEAPEDEIWPISFQFNSWDSGYATCGAAPVTATVNCCFKSLIPDESGLYLSSSPALITSQTSDLFNYGSVDMNRGDYCFLHANDESNLLYNDILILANGECIEKMKCTPSKELIVYNDIQCMEMNSTVILSDSPTIIQNDAYIGVTFAFVKSPKGALKYQWLTEIPQGIFVPNTNAIADRVQHICFGLYIIIILFCFYRLYFKRNQPYFQFLIILNFFWLLTISFRLYFLFYLGDDYQLYYGLYSVFDNLASISTVIHTLNIMINFRVEGNSTYIKACAFVFVILIQTLLTGYRYVQFCFAYHDQCIIGKNTTWYTWIAYWTIVFFTLNIIPIVYILLKFKHHKKDYFCYLYKHDATFVILFSYQLFNVILYYVIAMIQYYTVWPGSDRVYQCCNSIRFLLMYLHNANHLVLLDRLGKLIPTLKKIKKVPKN